MFICRLWILIGELQVCTVIDHGTWLLIYALLSQTMSDNSNKNLDKKVKDRRREPFECPLDSWCLQLLSDLSNSLYDRYQQLGGIEYLEESTACYCEGFNLCPIGDPNRSAFLNNLVTAVSGSHSHGISASWLCRIVVECIPSIKICT